MKARISLLIELVKRDYAVQYAGAGIGIFWAFFQSVITFIIFLSVWKQTKLEQSGASFSYTISGLYFWIPIQDLIQRSVGILSENRNIIKRSGISMEMFMFVPIIQMLIQILILAPIFIYAMNWFDLNAIFILGILVQLGTVLLIYPILRYLAMINLFLKDISQVIRLFLQVSFWSLPILYLPNIKILNYIEYNPIYYFLEMYRYLILKDYHFPILSASLILWFAVSYLIWFLVESKLKVRVLDHL
ncbi:MAG: ABC transporter permease [Leptospiraceae bacterium]|nr:ABC transporter permease [Leptospiraceae bacterium]